MKLVGRIGLYIGVGLIVLLLLLPTIISQGVTYFVHDAFQKQYAMNLNVVKLWINPFSGIVSVESVELVTESDKPLLRELEINVAMLQLIHKKIHIESLSLGGVNLRISQKGDGWIVNDLLLPAADNSSTLEQVPTAAEDVQPWHFSIADLSLQEIGFDFQNDQLTLKAQLQSLTVKNIDTETGQKSTIKSHFLIERIELPSQQLETSFELDVDTDLQLTLDGNEWQIKTSNRIDFDDLNLKIPQYIVGVKEIGFLSKIDGQYLDDFQYQIQSDLNVKNFSVKSSEAKKVDYLQVGSFSALNFNINSIDTGLMDLDKIEINNVQALPSVESSIPDLIKDGRLLVSTINIKTENSSGGITVDVDEVRMTDADINFMIGVDGEIPQLKIFNKSEKIDVDQDKAIIESSDQFSKKTETVEQKNRNQLRVNKIIIGPDVVVNFEDQSVSPAMEESVRFTQFEISNIEIPSENNATVQSLLDLSHEASFTLNGEFSVDKKLAKLDVNLNKYELLKVSGYSQKTTGYELESGTISLDSKINIDDRKLDLKNSILIDRINLRAKNSDKALRYANQLTMPLDEALDLLRDGNDQIKLKVPVDGNLDDPNIDVNQIINKALGGAMKKASISALKFMLQPYSTMISVAKFAGEQMSKIRLDPIVYEAGSNVLNEGVKDYVEKIASILTTKKSLSVKVCGLTNSEDEQFIRLANPVADPKAYDSVAYQKQLDKSLNQLSHDRSAGFKLYLIDTFNIDKNRLLTCLPDHSNEKAAVSGIELLL